VLKAQILGAATAAPRGKLKKFLNQEDAAWLNGVHSNPDDERVQRIFRAHRNDLENLLPFFVSGMLYLSSGGSVVFGATYFGIFLVARYAYSYAYLASRPRLRRDTYTVGWLVTIFVGVHAAWNAISLY
jgi:glutathione S-transferase